MTKWKAVSNLDFQSGFLSNLHSVFKPPKCGRG